MFVRMRAAYHPDVEVGGLHQQRLLARAQVLEAGDVAAHGCRANTHKRHCNACRCSCTWLPSKHTLTSP